VGGRKGPLEAVVRKAEGARLPDPAFWRGRKVLLTGHTGFKGSWLALWLLQLGAEVMGVSLGLAHDPLPVPTAAVGGTGGPK
jgi:hypothetical protein